ncbi:hypothetical protein DSL72_001895 [Monilinia vaccinii-corymbosi]|uniref:SprT-like domain-containing protein n=1 Tax=Monilinia vaccinii-corymbosi TaxID=61207 RepID=A0A8A3PB32_9HELO|nr:hypothetical protein DSL72_001895 [Monilinia vaccinii-corymbosi]
MGQTFSSSSTPVEKECDALEGLFEKLRQSQSLPGRLFYLEEPARYAPHASNFQDIDPKYRHIPKPSLGRPLTLRRARFFKHRPADLVLAVRSYIQPRDLRLTDMQNEAIRKWNEIDIMNCTDQFLSVLTKAILEKYFHIFDDLFFGGTLGEKVTIVASATPNDDAGLRGIARQDFDSTHNCYVPKSTITIYDHQDPIFGKRMRFFFNTLVHEMCHAFFQVYRCVGSCCDNDSLLELGPTGHGIMFQELAYDIERMAARKSVLGFKLNLGRYFNLLRDIWDEADWKDRMDVSRWGFDEQKIAKDLNKRKARSLKSVPH